MLQPGTAGSKPADVQAFIPSEGPVSTVCDCADRFFAQM